MSIPVSEYKEHEILVNYRVYDNPDSLGTLVHSPLRFCVDNRFTKSGPINRRFTNNCRSVPTLRSSKVSTSSMGGGMFSAMGVGIFSALGGRTLSAMGSDAFSALGIGMFSALGVGVFWALGGGMFLVLWGGALTALGVGVFLALGGGVLTALGGGALSALGSCVLSALIVSPSTIVSLSLVSPVSTHPVRMRRSKYMYQPFCSMYM